MAYSIVSIYGMNKELGNVSFYDSKQSDYSFQKPYSEATAEKIDIEVRLLVEGLYVRTKALLMQHGSELEVIAKELLEKEIIFQTDMERLIGKRPFESQTTYQKFTESEDKKEAEAEALKVQEAKTAAEKAASETPTSDNGVPGEEKVETPVNGAATPPVEDEKIEEKN
jgi:cell division protease FtsH